MVDMAQGTVIFDDADAFSAPKGKDQNDDYKRDIRSRILAGAVLPSWSDENGKFRYSAFIPAKVDMKTASRFINQALATDAFKGWTVERRDAKNKSGIALLITGRPEAKKDQEQAPAPNPVTEEGEPVDQTIGEDENENVTHTAAIANEQAA